MDEANLNLDFKFIYIKWCVLEKSLLFEKYVNRVKYNDFTLDMCIHKVMCSFLSSKTLRTSLFSIFLKNLRLVGQIYNL